MTLEEFAKRAGVTLTQCGPEWGGRVGYKTADSPNMSINGFRTEKAALNGWLKDAFGTRTASAILYLIKAAQKDKP